MSAPSIAGDEERSDGLLTRIASGSVRLRTDLPLVVLDMVGVIAAYILLWMIRLEGDVPAGFGEDLGRFVSVALVVHLLVNWMWGLYGQMWRHASVQEARRVGFGGATAITILLLIFLQDRAAPLSVVLLGGMTTTAIAGATRFQSRLFAFRRSADTATVRRVVVIGAGETGAVVVRDMFRFPDMRMRPVAVLDDDPRKQGRSLHGVPIVGGLDRIGEAVDRYGAVEALLAIPSADSELVRTVANLADRAELPLKVMPSVGELVNGQISVRDVRDLRIDDLLGRAQVHTDLDAVRSILTGKRVLVTGAGGSIGSEIVRQVSACDPAALLMLDHDETHLYETAADLDGDYLELLADIRDQDLMRAVFEEHRPQVVFHAAAHKHVPLLERYPCEAIRTNVVGTRNVVDAAVAVGVERFVFISTDKAVRPSSVMGASKRIAEQVVLANRDAGRFCAVRFGNVLGSRGSVVPRFMHQIAQGGPVTVTDARMTRFFMSIPEAVQLVLQASAFADGGEVFMLDMGEPVKIIDLAHRMIRLSGRRVGTDVPIRITGMRPGEKLHEELFVPEHEIRTPTPHPSIVAVHPPMLDRRFLDEGIARLADTARRRREEQAARAVHAFAAEQLELGAPARPLGMEHQTITAGIVRSVHTQEEEPAWRASIA